MGNHDSQKSLPKNFVGNAPTYFVVRACTLCKGTGQGKCRLTCWACLNGKRSEPIRRFSLPASELTDAEINALPAKYREQAFADLQRLSIRNLQALHKSETDPDAWRSGHKSIPEATEVWDSPCESWTPEADAALLESARAEVEGNRTRERSAKAKLRAARASNVGTKATIGEMLAAKGLYTSSFSVGHSNQTHNFGNKRKARSEVREES